MVALARIERRERASPDRLGTERGREVPFDVWFACTACDGRVSRHAKFCEHCGVKFDKGG